MNLIRQFFKNTLNPGFLNHIQAPRLISHQVVSLDFHSNASSCVNKALNCCPLLNTTKYNFISTKLRDFNMNQKREYKQKIRLRKRCKHCFFVWRCGRLYVECKEHPRHKQHHMFSMLKGFDSVAHGYDKKSPINHLY